MFLKTGLPVLAALFAGTAIADTVQFSISTNVEQSILTTLGHPDFEDLNNTNLVGPERFIFFQEHVDILNGVYDDGPLVWDPSQIPSAGDPGGFDEDAGTGRDYNVISQGFLEGTWTVDTSVFDGLDLSGNDYTAFDDTFDGVVLGEAENISTFSVTSLGRDVGSRIDDGSRIVVANNFVDGDETFDLVVLQSGNSQDPGENFDGGPALITLFLGGPSDWFEKSNGVVPDFSLIERAVVEFDAVARFGGEDPRAGQVFYEEQVRGEVTGPITIRNFGAADGSDEAAPLLPDAVSDTGAFEFELGEINSEEFVFIDPEIAVGYTYQVNGDGFITGIQAPSFDAVADADETYMIELPDGSKIQIGSGEKKLFSADQKIKTLILTGINGLEIDPLDTTTFVAGFRLSGASSNTGISQTPIIADSDALSPVPVPPAAALLLGGIAMFGALGRRRKSTRTVA